ncbi:MAG: Spy/CpxP family protein refolding chaperone [Kiritimatiellia bacterium]
MKPILEFGMLVLTLTWSAAQERIAPAVEAVPVGVQSRLDSMAEQGDLFAKGLFGREMAEKLGLTEEQQTALRATLRELHEKIAALESELAESARQQAERLTEDNVDEEALMRQVEETGRIRTEIAKLRLRALLLIRASLTPEQLKILRQIGAAQLREKREHDKRRGPPTFKKMPWNPERERWNHRKDEQREGQNGKDVLR